jgi:hypothetical protein
MLAPIYCRRTCVEHQCGYTVPSVDAIFGQKTNGDEVLSKNQMKNDSEVERNRLTMQVAERN